MKPVHISHHHYMLQWVLLDMCTAEAYLHLSAHQPLVYTSDCFTSAMQEVVLLEKRAAAEAVRQQAEAEAKQKAEAAAAEMAERKDLIAQLRGILAAGRREASRGRIHTFDPTEVRVSWDCFARAAG